MIALIVFSAIIILIVPVLTVLAIRKIRAEHKDNMERASKACADITSSFESMTQSANQLSTTLRNIIDKNDKSKETVY